MALTRSTLTARVRDGAGKGSARRLRSEGLVPAVVYGRHLEAPVHIAVDPVEVKKAITTPHRLNTLLSLKLDGQPERLVLLKDYQQDPVSREMLHADFIDVRENEQVKVNVPLEQIEADVSAMKIAQSLHINDVKLPQGVRVKSHVNFTIAVVSVPEKEEVVAPVAAATPVAGAPGAPGAAEAAPAAGDAKTPGGAPGAAPAAGGAKAPEGKGGGKKDDKKK